MQPILSQSMWTSLSNEQRNRFRAIFNIPRSSYIVVNDGRIETDGTTYEDFKHLTIEKMQAYLNDESTDFYKLFDKVVAKISNDSITATQAPIPVVSVTGTAEPKHRGRPAKNAPHA